MHQLQHVLFDLDGTLTDPGEGIIGSLQYSLLNFGIEGDPEILRRFIGPPLLDSFKRYFDLEGSKAKEAIRLYREHFHKVGFFQVSIYPGIPKLLEALTNQDKKLAIATTKPTIYAWQTLERFDIDSYFEKDLVVGSFLDGRRTAKQEIIGVVLEHLGKQQENKVMVGDTTYDVLGARAHGLDTISVTYGYGEKAELQSAKPASIVDSVEELSELLLDPIICE